MPIVQLQDGTVIELLVDDALAPAALRAFAGSTPLDGQVDALAMPRGPLVVIAVVSLLRWYRRVLSRRLGNRCVLDPSCSRYAELVVREHGVIRGMTLTIKRLFQCKPHQGASPQ